jgi:hypothetical protein
MADQEHDLAKMTAWGRGLEHDKRLLQEENARLKAECKARQAENGVLAVECDSLKAEVERLTSTIDASEEVLGKHQVRECIDESVNSWGCVDLPASIKGLVRKLEVADNYAQALEMVINAGTANELRLKAEVERLTTWQPMETAPLDGTDVMCVCLDPEFEGEDNPNRYIRTCFFGLMTEDYRCWMSVFGYEENPTHWMPLPAAPAKEDRP